MQRVIVKVHAPKFGQIRYLLMEMFLLDREQILLNVFLGARLPVEHLILEVTLLIASHNEGGQLTVLGIINGIGGVMLVTQPKHHVECFSFRLNLATRQSKICLFKVVSYRDYLFGEQSRVHFRDFL